MTRSSPILGARLALIVALAAASTSRATTGRVGETDPVNFVSAAGDSQAPDHNIVPAASHDSAGPAASENSARTVAKSESKALRLSLLGTLAPVGAGGAVFLIGATNQNDTAPGEAAGVGLASLGLLFGPLLGQRYVGSNGGLWLRLGALGVGGIAAASLHRSGNFDADIGSLIATLGIGAGVAVVFLGSSIHDIATVRRKAREWNAAHGVQPKVTWRIAPALGPGWGGVGATVSASF